jgi:hypothetical protein
MVAGFLTASLRRSGRHCGLVCRPSCSSIVYVTLRACACACFCVSDPQAVLQAAGAEREVGGGSFVNDFEAAVVGDLVTHMLHCGIDASRIGVICLYKAQVRAQRTSVLIAWATCAVWQLMWMFYALLAGRSDPRPHQRSVAARQQAHISRPGVNCRRVSGGMLTDVCARWPYHVC